MENGITTDELAYPLGAKPGASSWPVALAHLIPEKNSLLYFSLIFFWYGFTIDFKPSEPYLVPYLIDTKGFTNDQIEQDIFPIWTYAYFVSVVICGLVSEVVQYKPVLVLGSFARLATRLILIFGVSLRMMQATQLTFGFACGSEVLFYSYIYYLVPHEHYQKLTGITRSSVLIGHVGANLLGQLLVSKFHSPLIVLFYISFVSVAIATVISLCFPSTKSEVKSVAHTLQGLKSAAVDIVSNKEILQWCVWYVLVMACNDMVLNYSTNLFYVVDPSVSEYNGLVMALVRLSGALGAVLPGISMIEQKLELVRKPLVVILTLMGGLLVMATTLVNIWLVFAFFILYMGSITFGISVASAQIAKSMSTRKFAMVFALVTIVYLGIETIFQFVIGSTVLALGSKQMFAVFGAAVVLAALAFATVAGVFVAVAGVVRMRARSSRYSRVDTDTGSIN